MSYYTKKFLCVLLALVMSLALGACGGDKAEESSDGGEAADASGETENIAAEESTGGTLAAVDYVQAAMDAADRLTSGSYFLMEDGSILAADYGVGHTHASVYAAMPDVRKLVDSCSQMELFALTENGELYYQDGKILEDVSDAIYCTNNMNQEAIAAAGSDIYRIFVEDAYSQSALFDPDTYLQVGSETVQFYTVTHLYMNPETNAVAPEGTRFVQVASDKHNYMALTDEGKLYLPMSEWEPAELQGLDFSKWENLVLIDLMREKNEDTDVTEVTVAGIQADGTVLAEGKYAQDILGWGELAYISMNNGLIAGLGRDGTLKLAGPLAEEVAPEVTAWTDLVAVRVGGDSGYGDMVLSAIDSQGVCHRLYWNEHGGISMSQCTADAGPSDKWWYKYDSDGSVLCSSGANGAWEPYEG